LLDGACFSVPETAALGVGSTAARPVRLIWAGKNLTILAPDGSAALRGLTVAADLVARVDRKVAVEAIAGVLS
jgi:hypothetical protein